MGYLLSYCRLSFTQGFLLGQLSIVLLFGIFIKFFIFGDAPSADATASRRISARRQRTLARKGSFGSITDVPNHSSRRKQSIVLRQSPPTTIPTILNKTYYNVDSHLPESVDWFNVLIAQAIAQFRSDAEHDDALLASLSSVFNGSHKPDFLDEIKVTELHLGDDFPILSNCRIIPVEGDTETSTVHGKEKGQRLQARMDVDLSDCITLGVETKLVLNHPKPMLAVLPVALAVSVVRFSGTVISPSSLRFGEAYVLQLSISFVPSSPSTPSPTTLTFSFLDDYRLDLSIHSLLGSRTRLQDVPKIAQIIESRLHTWFDERCVEPRFQQIVLPSLWPRKKNTRGGEDLPILEGRQKHGDAIRRGGSETRRHIVDDP